VFKNALVSVSDKSGLVEFLKPLVAQGLRVVSTGGTLKHLRENGIAAVDVTEQTGFPEVMDGRVKTLHPRVHMALLARQTHEADQSLLKKENLEAFDLVVVNLYPFEQAKARGAKGDELIEYIDVGGPSMLRAAAKNHERIAVVCQPKDYEWIAARAGEGNKLTLQERRNLAATVFRHTAAYDDLIAKSLEDGASSQDAERSLTLSGRIVSELRYGENPHQKAWWLRDPSAQGGLHEAKILHGKPLSYNNLLDLDAAVAAVADFDEPCAVAVKHNNPCGVGTETTISAAVKRAIDADPVSVFGGIIALNKPVDLESAETMGKIFLECIIAPAFEPAALERLQKKKDLRLLEWPALAMKREENQFRTVAGGFLVQTPDTVTSKLPEWRIVGNEPTEKIWRDLLLAWKVCARLKSNAIAIAADGRTVGLGMGQVNRVDAVQHAIERMSRHHEQAKLTDVCLASDAFFPFADSIEKAADAGIRWIIQPGGSIRDEDVLAKARERGLNMILTGRRHFKH
jgi:phosphoribosylaminoimidazolecarboxamide formyltransferase / IMP cyclohydrolase